MSDTEALPVLSVFPIANPTKPTSVRRSHSVASLPTPPSTIRKRSHSRASSVFSEDEHIGAASADDALLLPTYSPQPQPKKRRRVEHSKGTEISAGTTTLADEDEDEDEFWGPSRPSAKQQKSRGRTLQREPSVTASASRAAAAATLLSPPPTRPRVPATPPARATTSKDAAPLIRPTRDSPNNPFLQSDDSPNSAPPSPVGPKTPLPEAPTMTYVFRGKKQIFVNPFYKATRDPRADLPTRHPDFSPSEYCTPRRLFSRRTRAHPVARRPKDAPAPDKPERARSPDPWSSDEEGGVRPMPRMSLAEEFARIAKDQNENKKGPSAEAHAAVEAHKVQGAKASSNARRDAAPPTLPAASKVEKSKDTQRKQVPGERPSSSATSSTLSGKTEEKDNSSEHEASFERARNEWVLL